MESKTLLSWLSKQKYDKKFIQSALYTHTIWKSFSSHSDFSPVPLFFKIFTISLEIPQAHWNKNSPERITNVRVMEESNGAFHCVLELFHLCH